MDHERTSNLEPPSKDNQSTSQSHNLARAQVHLLKHLAAAIAADLRRREDSESQIPAHGAPRS